MAKRYGFDKDADAGFPCECGFICEINGLGMVRMREHLDTCSVHLEHVRGNA